MARTKTVKRKRVNYEALLAKEGLAPLDRDGAMLHETGERSTRGGAQATAEWLAWAAGVAGTFPFHTARQRRVWTSLAQGRNWRQTAKALRITRDNVRYDYRTVAALVSPPPVPNPWRRNVAETEVENEPMTLVDAVAMYPATAAEMLNAATRYIDELGEDCMLEYKGKLGVIDEDEPFGTAAEWNTGDARINSEGTRTPHVERVTLPSDGVPSELLCGAVRSLSRDEIAKLNYTPPKKIGVPRVR